LQFVATEQIRLHVLRPDEQRQARKLPHRPCEVCNDGAQTKRQYKDQIAKRQQTAVKEQHHAERNEEGAERQQKQTDLCREQDISIRIKARSECEYFVDQKRSLRLRSETANAVKLHSLSGFGQR
jgi:hypothetical protein